MTTPRRRSTQNKGRLSDGNSDWIADSADVDLADTGGET